MEELSNVKVGDKVIYYMNSNPESAYICTVTEVTKSGNIRINKLPTSLFKPDGHLRGAGTWDSDLLVPYNDAEANKITEAKVIRHASMLMYKVSTSPLNLLDIEKAKKIIEILEDTK